MRATEQQKSAEQNLNPTYVPAGIDTQKEKKNAALVRKLERHLMMASLTCVNCSTALLIRDFGIVEVLQGG